MQLSEETIREVQTRLRPVIKKPTELMYSERLSQIYGFDVYLKREDSTSVRSYKVRWAFNMISQLTRQERKKWIVTASAGNHAQWVALSCKKLWIHGTIFMPVTTPEQKIESTKDFWWTFITIKLVGDTFDDSKVACLQFQKENWSVFIPPFDNEKVIAGQATVWAEIFDQIEHDTQSEVDLILAPIWWWGLISWISLAKKAFGKSTKIIWVEPSGAASMKHALETWENTGINEIGDIFVDGACVKKVWDLTFQICRDEKIEIITCPEWRISTTMLDLLNKDGIVTEPAGALSIDALKDLSPEIVDRLKKTQGKVVCVVSWGNFDFERLSEVKERSLKFEWMKKFYSVIFPQRPWALEEYLEECIDKSLWDDIEFIHYQKKSPSQKAPVIFAIKVKEKSRFTHIEANMQKYGFSFTDETNNPLAYLL